jgi:hypothetical protein
MNLSDDISNNRWGKVQEWLNSWASSSTNGTIIGPYQSGFLVSRIKIHFGSNLSTDVQSDSTSPVTRIFVGYVSGSVQMGDTNYTNFTFNLRDRAANIRDQVKIGGQAKSGYSGPEYLPFEIVQLIFTDWAPSSGGSGSSVSGVFDGWVIEIP